jgi:hypothetical protein
MRVFFFIMFILPINQMFGQDIEVINKNDFPLIKKGNFNFYIDTINNQTICVALNESYQVKMICLFINNNYESIYSDFQNNVYPSGSYFFVENKRIKRITIQNISNNYFVIDYGKKDDNYYFLKSENEIRGLIIMIRKKNIVKVIIGM